MKLVNVRIIAAFLCLTLISCNGFRHHDFSKRKYLDLKNHHKQITTDGESDFTDPVEESALENENPDKPEPKPGTEFSLKPEVVSEEYNVSTSDNIESAIPVSENASEDNIEVPEYTENRAREVVFPTKPLEKFDALFQVGFMMVIVGLLLLGMALTASNLAMLLICVVSGIGLLIAAWIISFIAIKTSKSVAPEDKTDGFVVKRGLAYVLNIIGWLVLAINIAFWGFIALLLL